MLLFFKCLISSLFVGLVCALLAVGAIGIWSGMPLAFLEFLPGDDLEELRQLPRDMLTAGFLGFLIGTFAGLASQMTRKRISYSVSVLIVAISALAAIRWTHPGLNLTIDSGIVDYLESYRLTGLAILAGSAVVFTLGVLSKPFQRDKP